MKVKAKGDTDLTTNDFESMPYLVAITKVRPSYFLCLRLRAELVDSSQGSLRVRPIGAELVRTLIEGDIVSLTKPIVGNSGMVYAKLHIPKGTAVNLSVIGHNSYVFFYYQVTTSMTEPPRYRFHARNEDL